MPAKNLSHLAQLIANDGHAASFQSLGQYRTALLKEIAQARAQLPAGGAAPSGADSIQCWSCEMDVSLDDRADADGSCPHCSVELDLEEYLRTMLAAPHPVSGEQKAVGEIVIFGSDLKEVSWSGGKMPAPGTKLYAAQPAAQDVRGCTWKRDEDAGYFNTGCGSTWQYMDGGDPGEHGQNYCHHCGKNIEIAHRAQAQGGDV